MPKTDFIADFLTIIRNAVKAHKDKVSLPASNITVRIADILKDEGFIHQTKVFTEGKKRMIRVHLKYISDKKAAIQGIRRISKPGLRQYVPTDKIPKIQGGLGIAILSTSKGVMTDREARQLNTGGEILCAVW